MTDPYAGHTLAAEAFDDSDYRPITNAQVEALLENIESQIDRNAIGRTCGLQAVADLRTALAAAQAAAPAPEIPPPIETLPSCMIPDGGEPCEAYQKLTTKLAAAQAGVPPSFEIEEALGWRRGYKHGFAAGIEAAAQAVKRHKSPIDDRAGLMWEIRALRPTTR